MKIKKQAKAAAKKQPNEAEAVSAPKVADYERKRTELEVAKLKVAPWNPRQKITPESVADLAASIESLGVIEPLVAMMDADGGATLLSGHRRLAAAKVAKLDKVPCDILVGIDEPTAKRMTFIANLQRKDADPLLESELVGGLVKSGMTQDEIAAETGRGRDWVARRLNLSRLSKSWRKRVKDGEQITTDCLEHVAAYPEEVQERLKGAKTYQNTGAALRWCDIESQFDRETQDLKKAVFDRTPCKTCPNNTGCSPDLFDWDVKPAAYGKCMDGKCYKRKVEEAIKATIADAKANGAEVRESKQHPDYSISLQSKPDKKHDTLYVWKNWNDETVMQWGESPKQGKPGVGMSDEDKEARKRKLAANKARRKLAAWCESNLSGVIMAAYTVDVQIAIAFQRVFGIGCEWRVFGSQTNTEDAARAYLLDPGAQDFAPMERWASLAAAEIAAKLVKPEIGAKYAELLIAILPPVAEALTDEERQLVASDATVLKLREPVKVVWASSSTEADDGEDEEPFDDEETED